MLFQKCRELSLPLITGAAFALILANVFPEFYKTLVYSPLFNTKNINMYFLINDIFMVFFFGLAAAEIKRSLSPGGALYPVKKAVTPLMATAGGVLAPILVFSILNSLIGSPDYSNGWGIPTATDVAISWLVAKSIFGKKHPAVSFLLLLAVADDGAGLFIIAAFYPDPQRQVEISALAAVAVAILIAYMMNRRNAGSFWLYVLIPGHIAWLGLYNAALHPALSLIFIIPFIPSEPFAGGKSVHRSALQEFKNKIGPLVDCGLLFFGLTNAGVEISSVSSLTLIIFLSLVIGKTAGIALFTLFACLLGFGLPKGMNAKDVAVLGIVAGMGLTVALFVAGCAYTDVNIAGAAKMGALCTVLIAPIAIVAGKALRIKKVN